MNEFIMFQVELPRRKEFDMFHITDYSGMIRALKKIVGVSLINNIFSPHPLGHPEVQELYNPIVIGNMVADTILKGLHQKKTFIMNEVGGYQVYDPAVLASIGWTEMSREMRSELTFKKPSHG